MINNDHDMLVELNTKITYILEGVTKLNKDNSKQWEKIDEHSQKLATHSESIGGLKKAFWFILSTVIGSGSLFWLIKD